MNHRDLFVPVLIALVVLLGPTPAEAGAPWTCRTYAKQALTCLDVRDEAWEDQIRAFCTSVYDDTRGTMAPGPRRAELRDALRSVPCESIREAGPLAALDRAVQDFATTHGLADRLATSPNPLRRHRAVVLRRMRLDDVSLPSLPPCPDLSKGLPETRVCRYRQPAAPSPDRPDMVLVISGGMFTGMTLLRHVADPAIAFLAERFDVWAFVAEAEALDSARIASLRWQIGNLARAFVADHPGARVVLMGYSNGAAQVWHAINKVFPRHRFASARPALAVLVDVVDGTPFVDRTLVVAPGLTRVLTFHGAWAGPGVHGAHRVRCVAPQDCTHVEVLGPDGKPGGHGEIPGLVAISPVHRKVIEDAFLDALQTSPAFTPEGPAQGR